ncbi:MAG: hypothetical protein ACTSUE_10570 [Promethearchaeota archaeon]
MTDQEGKKGGGVKAITPFTADDYSIMRDLGFRIEKDSLIAFSMNNTIVVTTILEKLKRDLFRFSEEIEIERGKKQFHWNRIITRTNKKIYKNLCDFVSQYFQFLRIKFIPSSFNCFTALKMSFYTDEMISRENVMRLKGLWNTVQNSVSSHLSDKVFMGVVKHSKKKHILKMRTLKENFDIDEKDTYEELLIKLLRKKVSFLKKNDIFRIKVDEWISLNERKIRSGQQSPFLFMQLEYFIHLIIAKVQSISFVKSEEVILQEFYEGEVDKKMERALYKNLSSIQ